MSNDSEVKVIVDLESGGFKDGTDQVVDSSAKVSDVLEQLKTNAESAGPALDEAGKAASAFGASISTMVEAMALGVAGGLGLEDVFGKLKDVLVESTVGTFDFAESVRNLSIGTGLSTDQVQALQYAGDITGVSMGRLQQEVNSVARAMTEFADNSKRATAAAATLGLDPSKWTDAYDALTQIGEKYKELTASGQQLSLANEQAFQVFLGGKFGMQSLAALERLPELEEAARSSGVIMGKDMIESSDKSAESIHKLTAEFRALEHAIGAALAPAATLAMQGIGERVFGLQPDEGGGVAGNDKGSGEMMAETLAPATDAQQQLQKAVTSTSSAIDLQSAAMKELAGIAPDTMAKIRESGIALDAQWQQMFHNFDNGAATAHVQQYWAELRSAADQAAQTLKDDSEVIASVITPITSAFEQSFTGVIQGTQTMSQAWAKMLDSMALELVKSGLHDLLMGGAKNTIGADIFGTTGAGGGIAGALASAFQGSAIEAGLKTSLTSAWTSLTAPITSVFGQAFNAIGGIIKNLFGSALSGAGSALASVGAGAATGAAGQTAEATAISGAIATSTATIDAAIAALGVSIGADITAETVALVTAITVGHPSILGFSAAAGAVIPSFGGGGLGGGTIGIVHPNEMILDPRLSEFVQRAAASASGTGGGGGGDITIVQNNTINGGADAASLRTALRAHADEISDAVLHSIRSGRATGQNVQRGNFRR
jgi:hypothetical protein